MKRFSFRLDNILIYRDYLEKKAQRDLLDARNKYKEMKSKVKKLTRKRIANAIKYIEIYRSFLDRRLFVVRVAMVLQPKPRTRGIMALPLNPILSKILFVKTHRFGIYPTSSRTLNAIKKTVNIGRIVKKALARPNDKTP